MKIIRFNKIQAKKISKRLLLMFSVNLFTSAFVLGIAYLSLVYLVPEDALCSKKDQIISLDSAYQLKTDLTREKELNVADASYYDVIAQTSSLENFDMEGFVADKTERDLRIGAINTSISEMNDHINDIKKCEFSGNQIDQRIKSIRNNIFGQNPIQSSEL